MIRQIIAFGGGGFSMESSPLLDDYILSRARDTTPRVCFLPTASADSPSYIVRFYREFTCKDCIPSDLTLGGMLPRYPPTTPQISEFLAAQDVIYVGGGNTANMLALWRAHGIDRALRTAWEGGSILCGLSAGMICWFRAAVTDSFGDLDPFLDGLGLLPTSACPHYDSERGRRPRYQALIEDGTLPPGIAADDGVALVYEGEELKEVVASRPNAAAYRVEGVGKETRIEPRFLGT